MDADPGEREEIRLFLDAIHVEYGYDLRTYAPASMRRRILVALAKSGLGGLSELRLEVLRDPSLFARVIEDLTVRVSDMFRDPTFYRAFRARVVPLLRTYPLLNIWHCGCASGEEVYSTAILLLEEGLYDRTQVYATDLSPAALEQAKTGVYTAERLPGFAMNYLRSGGTSDFSNYYTAAYDRIAFTESLRRKVLFFQHDLVSDEVFGEMHVILCRNVLIYFDSVLRQQVLGKLARSVHPGGFLCLGSSERLPRSNLGAFGEFVPDERIYRQQLDVAA